jgi:peptidyl-prolyl cis-trans isomerase C
MDRSSYKLLAVTLCLAAACSRDGKSGPTVAKGDGVVITAGEFKKKLDEQSPFIRSRFASIERKKEFLESLIRFELLAAEAERQDLEKDPEVRESLRKLMVQRLLRKNFDEKEQPDAVPEEKLREYYDSHKEEFDRPERVRVAQILFRADRGSPDRARKGAEAAKALARVRGETRSNPLAFANVARDVSDDVTTRTSGGDLGYRTREELAETLGREPADAAFALKSDGQETSIVESAIGFHLLKLTARQPAVKRPFEEVKAQLASRVSREERTRSLDAFLKKLREKADIKIDAAELEKIPVDAAPSIPAAPNAPYPSSGPVPPAPPSKH